MHVDAPRIGATLFRTLGVRPALGLSRADCQDRSFQEANAVELPLGLVVQERL
jgi:hypothetical protein